MILVFIPFLVRGA